MRSLEERAQERQRVSGPMLRSVREAVERSASTAEAVGHLVRSLAEATERIEAAIARVGSGPTGGVSARLAEDTARAGIVSASGSGPTGPTRLGPTGTGVPWPVDTAPELVEYRAELMRARAENGDGGERAVAQLLEERQGLDASALIRLADAGDWVARLMVEDRARWQSQLLSAAVAEQVMAFYRNGAVLPEPVVARGSVADGAAPEPVVEGWQS